MCLAVLALHTVPGIPVLIAANRDEFHARPTLPAAQWADAAHVYGGRDALAGGTWMGATTGGRYALVTNFREPGRVVADAPSRGALVENFLRGHAAPADYIAAAHAAGPAYNGFNLIVGDARAPGTPATAMAPPAPCGRRLRPVEPPAGHALAQAGAHQGRLRTGAGP